MIYNSNNFSDNINSITNCLQCRSVTNNNAVLAIAVVHSIAHYCAAQCALFM